jgi:hypothetical protein
VSVRVQAFWSLQAAVDAVCWQTWFTHVSVVQTLPSPQSVLKLQVVPPRTVVKVDVAPVVECGPSFTTAYHS